MPTTATTPGTAEDGADSPEVLDLPIGLDALGTRRETDSLGAVEVLADRYWGAQTQRSLIHFSIGDDRMPKAVYHAYGHVKKAAALAHGASGQLPRWKADLIARVCDEVIAGELDDHFPLYVWQTGSGTQSNMNLNEVISNRCIQLVGGELASKAPVHPNDDVNKGQSSNDTFPTAMHIAALGAILGHLVPSAQQLQAAFEARSRQWHDVVKTGRTHLQDAVPLTVGQEWSGYAAQIAQAVDRVQTAAEGLHEVAMGGTAVGTGLNAPPGFAADAIARMALATGRPLTPARNTFAAQGGLEAMVAASAGIRALAVPLMKIANDVRWLASGPRCGIGELVLPENEPGSSIMPGKVNPTQCEAMVMVCIQVLSEDGCVAFAGSQGNFELNAMRPIIVNNVLHMAAILGDACTTLREYCIEGTELDRDRIGQHVERSLMLVTALAPVIGYDRASAIAHRAQDDGSTLREAALASGDITAEDFDRTVDPRALVGPL